MFVGTVTISFTSKSPTLRLFLRLGTPLPFRLTTAPGWVPPLRVYISSEPSRSGMAAYYVVIPLGDGEGWELVVGMSFMGPPMGSQDAQWGWTTVYSFFEEVEP